MSSSQNVIPSVKRYQEWRASPYRRDTFQYYAEAVALGYLTRGTRTKRESICSVCGHRSAAGIRKFLQDRPVMTNGVETGREKFWCHICDGCWDLLTPAAIPVQIKVNVPA